MSSAMARGRASVQQGDAVTRGDHRRKVQRTRQRSPPRDRRGSGDGARRQAARKRRCAEGSVTTKPGRSCRCRRSAPPWSAPSLAVPASPVPPRALNRRRKSQLQLEPYEKDILEECTSQILEASRSPAEKDRQLGNDDIHTQKAAVRQLQKSELYWFLRPVLQTIKPSEAFVAAPYLEAMREAVPDAQSTMATLGFR